MDLTKLAPEVQSIFNASSQIRTYKTAVEELVYNALDANSSCIAIRVNIQEDYIQVVDNGHGVASDDFKILGQRHTTSKFENPSTSIKSIQKYGWCGQSLANLIEVSQRVKITSKCINNPHFTWLKHFYNGKEEECSITAERPSIGTTVEIKGFLYNLTIQKKALKALQELQNIKMFLVQMSLLHCNTSISLRNNFRNEIIFKIHRNRDITQTLASLLDIKTENIREFRVEKNQYRVTGFIQTNSEEAKDYQWIYVNGRFINNCNLHKIMNENLAKGRPTNNKMKTKVYNEDENALYNNELPDYFLFIECPRNNYDVKFTTKQSIMQFKNIVQVNKLLEKLVKFYMGDINLAKTIIEPILPLEPINDNETNTRSEVKQIIQKILGTQQRKMSGSNLRNGVKGKMIRRKAKAKVVPSPNSHLKLKYKNDKCIQEEIYDSNDLIMNDQNEALPKNHIKNNKDNATTIFRLPASRKKRTTRFGNANQRQKQANYEKHLQHATNNIAKIKCDNINKESILCKFEKETNEVQRRCNILSKKVDHLLGVKKKRKCKVFTNSTVHYSNIVKNNKSISIRKKINEIIIHEYLPLPQNIKAANNDVTILNGIKKTNDLVRPVTTIVNQHQFPKNVRRAKIVELHQSDSTLLHDTDPPESKIPRLTYESHSYLKEALITRPKDDQVKKCEQTRFISKASRDNFASPKTQRKVIKKQNVTKKLQDSKVNDRLLTNVEKSSYSIYFTQSNSRISETREITLNRSEPKSLNNSTYTVTISGPRSTERGNSKNTPYRTYILDTTCNEEANWDSATNLSLYCEQSSCIQKTQNKSAVTVETPDNNVIFISNLQQSNTEISDIEPLNFCETVIGYNDEGDHAEYSFIFDSINNVSEGNIPNDTQTRGTLDTVLNCNGSKSEEDNYLNMNLKNIFKDYKHDAIIESNTFNLNNRRRYVPKGLSPIFNNCMSKNVCNYEFDKDYFEENVYNKFEQNIRIHSEIFEPKIQNVKEAASRAIQRVDKKFNKDNECLTFNGESLKQATVLGQVDHKFIATIIKATSNGAQNCLVLFDQHAVHERIRLEQNMSEYITEGQWKSVSLDGISLKLTTDEILYLHNYRDKFQRLGLQWSVVSDSQVLVNAIPEAILGKQPRQVDIVLKAVKSLIKEEINIITEQGGCVSLYPKSIMDLVFSEACRYAVMFGDALSARECAALVEELARCVTPFQCAHGRPAMAVLVGIVRETRPYTVNFTKVEEFRRKHNKFK